MSLALRALLQSRPLRYNTWPNFEWAPKKNQHIVRMLSDRVD